VNADAKPFRKLILCQANESAQRGDITWLESTRNDSLPLRSSQGSAKFFTRDFFSVAHRRFPTYSA